jgi:hypothetical protein
VRVQRSIEGIGRPGTEDAGRRVPFLACRAART